LPSPVTPTHPLARLSADEIDAARQIITAAGLVTETTRFAYLGLAEPTKAEVLAHTPGAPVPRRVKAVLIDLATGAAQSVLASLTSGAVEQVEAIDTRTQGQPAIMEDDIITVDEIVKADPGWVAAMAKRGLTDLDQIRPCPLSPGEYGFPGEEGRRLLRVLSFVQHRPDDHPWAHPVDGVVAYVDLIERKVIKLIDHRVLPVPKQEHNHDDPAYTGPTRTTLKPLDITQPEGPSFTVDGDAIRWDNWRLRIGFDAREGLVLYQITYVDQGRERPIIYRASVGEMVVPYGDPSPTRFWQNYFDIGEYLIGQQVNSLELGCDCLGEIYYFDAVLPTTKGEPRVVKNAICLHEEDYGVLWKHTDIFTGSSQVRRQRRLVVSYFATIGNYDYGFYWYFYLDGTIQLEVKATGVIFTEPHIPGNPYASQVTAELAGPYHQHLYNVRLDMMVDGLTNAVEELDTVRVRMGPGNEFGNAFTRSVTRLRRESEAVRDAHPAASRVWKVINPERRNAVGQPVGYALIPHGGPLLLADENASVRRRGAFATHHLWVTRYHPDERFPAGEFINANPGGAGLPAYVAQDRDIDGEDIVLWHTFGVTHFPRPEDWPVMPVDYAGFTLKPVGFFDRNPTLDLPATTTTHCHPGGHGGHDHGGHDHGGHDHGGHDHSGHEHSGHEHGAAGHH
jgi:primary-amine oxidase